MGKTRDLWGVYSVFSGSVGRTKLQQRRKQWQPCGCVKAQERQRTFRISRCWLERPLRRNDALGQPRGGKRRGESAEDNGGQRDHVCGVSEADMRCALQTACREPIRE